jgi:hypothetical protein
MRDDARNWEALLARLFVDEELRARFKRDPKAVALEFGLEASTTDAFADTDWIGLDLAAGSYRRKRERR